MKSLPNLSGHTLNGKYQLLQLQGEGAAGQVYQAHLLLDFKPIEQVAIKIIYFDPNNRTEAQKQFEAYKRELAPIRKTNSVPNIILIRGYDQSTIYIRHDGSVLTDTRVSELVRDESLNQYSLLLLIMDYAEGGELGPQYRQQMILDAKDDSYLTHLIDIASALETIHSHGITHRDVKPNNLLFFRRQNQVKLADLGIASVTDTPTDHTVVGTLPYMSPECFHGSRDPARDRYALACTIYQLYTGSFPMFPDTLPTNMHCDPRSDVEVWREVHKKAERPHAVSFVPDLISLRLSDLLHRSMSADPGERPPDLKELIDTLKDEKIHRFGQKREYPRIALPSELPDGPVYHSDYPVHPHFRQRLLSEQLNYLVIDLERSNRERLGEMLACARDIFGNTFSICDVYGNHDLILRVWVRPNSPELMAFCDVACRHVLFGNRRAISIFTAEEIETIPRLPDLSPTLNVSKAKIHLNTAQNTVPSGANPKESDRRKKACQWLVRNKVYLSRLSQPKSLRILGFTMADLGPGVSIHEEQANFALIVRKLIAAASETRLTNMVVHRRLNETIHQYPDGKPIPSYAKPFLITFQAAKMQDTIFVPDCLDGELDGTGIRTRTMLSTGRLLIDSHQAYPQ